MIDYSKLTHPEFSILVKSVFILAQIPEDNCPLSLEEKTALNGVKGDLWAEMVKRGMRQ